MPNCDRVARQVIVGVSKREILERGRFGHYWEQPRADIGQISSTMPFRYGKKKS